VSESERFLSHLLKMMSNDEGVSSPLSVVTTQDSSDTRDFSLEDYGTEIRSLESQSLSSYLRGKNSRTKIISDNRQTHDLPTKKNPSCNIQASFFSLSQAQTLSLSLSFSHALSSSFQSNQDIRSNHVSLKSPVQRHKTSGRS
jgi:type IV secretory pathway VirB9-like protein